METLILGDSIIKYQPTVLNDDHLLKINVKCFLALILPDCMLDWIILYSIYISATSLENGNTYFG